MFNSWRLFSYRLIDFHRPSSTDGKHPALIEWVKTYFREPSEFKPPLYFQHQGFFKDPMIKIHPFFLSLIVCSNEKGHSRTIVGIEEVKQASLLILDPSHKPDQVKGILKKNVWVSLAALKAKQYQIVCVDNGFVDDEQEYLVSGFRNS